MSPSALNGDAGGLAVTGGADADGAASTDGGTRGCIAVGDGGAVLSGGAGSARKVDAT